MTKSNSGPKQTKEIVIKPPNFKILEIEIEGTAPYVSNHGEFEKMRKTQEEGDAGKTGRGKRAPKDFPAAFQASMHRDMDGTVGYIPAVAFLGALVRAGYNCGIDMTTSKASLQILSDAQSNEGKGLVRITKGAPEHFETDVRNSNGSADIRARARWPIGWEVVLRIRYDADLMKEETVANLVYRAGSTIGVGAGRPFSKQSVGQGWGTFQPKARKLKKTG